VSLSFDLFWSFRSPYSYLATPRLVRLVDEYDVDLVLKPVLPIAVRIDNFFDNVNPLWPTYLLGDTVRIADCEDIPYGWPNPDPIVQHMSEDGRIITDKDQPYIYRLTRLGVEAARRGRGLPFIYEVSRIIFGGAVQGWDEGDHLAQASKRAGLDLDDLEAAVEADTAGHDEEISANQAALEAAGHWGVPTMVFGGEPFFGQDRIELLLWRMKKNGLVRR